MAFKFLRCAVVLAFMVLPALTVLADSAEQAFTQGKDLLAKADFDGALKSFAQAAKADRSKPEYLQQYALVNQVVELRKRLATERDPAQWENYARALHAFYSDTWRMPPFQIQGYDPLAVLPSAEQTGFP